VRGFHSPALARNSNMEMAGVSSNKHGAFDRRPAAFVSNGQSDGERNPVRTLWHPPEPENTTYAGLIVPWTFPGKIATGYYVRDRHAQQWTPQSTFTIDGRPAMMIRSEFCKPEVLLSKSVKPVGTPVMDFLC